MSTVPAPSPIHRPVRAGRAARPGPEAGMREGRVRLHGRSVAYLEAGADTGGPVVVLLHGLASSSTTWARAMPELGRHAHIVAPDLLGHGRSDKPRTGDYSLGSYASGLRDLMVALGIERATLVGHSFGGGVAMQFAYQFPERTERVALVSSGGLGQNVTIALRAATLPGAPTALQLMATVTPRWVALLVRRAVRAAPGLAGADLEGLISAFASFADDGVRDAVIPVTHTVDAHGVLPHSRPEIFDGAGHFPHVDDPHRFAMVLTEFLRQTTGARIDVRSICRRLRTPVGDRGATR